MPLKKKNKNKSQSAIYIFRFKEHKGGANLNLLNLIKQSLFSHSALVTNITIWDPRDELGMVLPLLTTLCWFQLKILWLRTLVTCGPFSSEQGSLVWDKLKKDIQVPKYPLSQALNQKTFSINNWP